MSELEQRFHVRGAQRAPARRGGRVRLSTSHPERRRAAKTRVWDFRARAAINLKGDAPRTPRRHRGISGLGYEVASKVTLGARDYDPAIARWLSKDPIRFRGGINLYVYSWNDPVNFFDRTGREPTSAGGASNSGEGGGEGAGNGAGNGEPSMCGGEDGYGDFNITAGLGGLGATGGYFYDANGEVHFYAGVGATTSGVSTGFSNSIWGSPSPGQGSAQ